MHSPVVKNIHLINGKIDKFGRPSEHHPIDINDKYLLSTKRSCIYENLDDVVNSKVNSLKIEGRMRSADYVGIVV